MFLHLLQNLLRRLLLKQRPSPQRVNRGSQQKKTRSGYTTQKPWLGSKRCNSKINDDAERKKGHLAMQLLTTTPEHIQEERQHARQDRYAFSNPAERANHVRLFFAWLSPVLRDAPGIEWEQLPSQV